MGAAANNLAILTGMIAAEPWQGGLTWVVLNHFLGLRSLGYDVHFIEPVPQGAIRPAGVSLAQSENAAYFNQVAARYGLAERATLLDTSTRETVGASFSELVELGRRADVLLNVAGMLTNPEITGRIPTRVYLDLDPAFTQLWHTAEGIDMRFEGHTHFATVGLLLGSSESAIPTCGHDWIPTCQPIALDHWPVADRIVHDGLTTVANWRGYGSIHHQGTHYGQKAHSLRPLMDLPTHTDEPFKLGLAIHPDEHTDLAALHANGWQLLDPAEVARTPADFHDFVQGSRAEFGLAKSGYVAARCGWFSDRSACYLASGRPVVAQDTGFSRVLPTGSGLFAWDTADEVLAAAEELRHNYTYNARAARAIAEEYFDANKVLRLLLQRVGLSA